MPSTGPPSVSSGIGGGVSIGGISTSSELVDGNVGDRAPVNLRNPLLDLGRVEEWCFIEYWPFGGINDDCTSKGKCGKSQSLGS